MADQMATPDAQDIQNRMMAAEDARVADQAAAHSIAAPADASMQQQSNDTESQAAPPNAPPSVEFGAGLSASSQHTVAKVQLPPAIPISLLKHVLLSASDPPRFTEITEEQILSPNNDMIVYLYSIALQFPGLRQRVISLEEEKVSWIAQQGVQSETIQALRERVAQMEQALDSERTSALEAARLKDSLQTELLNLETQLGSAQTALENEKREAAAAKEERKRLESELTASNNQVSSLKTEVETERRAKELVSSEKDRLSAELVGVTAQLSTLKSSTESGVRQVAEVRGRLEQVEQEKRDLLGSLQREREENTRKAEEIESLLTRNHDARQEISRLSSAIQESRSQASIAQFKLQGLEQELQLTKTDATWAHGQLNKINEASTSFRAEKRVEISRLQADLDAAQQESSAARAKLASLQTAYDESSNRLNESSEKVAELQSRLATQEDSFRSEISTQSQLVKLLERRAEHASQRISELEDQWEEVLEQCRIREESAWAETQKEAQLREALEKQNQELSEALDRLAEGVGIGQQRENADADLSLDFLSDAGNGNDFDIRSGASTPRRMGLMGTAASFNGIGISPTADIANRLRKSGKSFSQIYMELAKTQEELRRERLETNRLSNVLSQVMDELQDRAPQLQAQREETEKLSRDLDEMVQQVAVASQERDAVKSEAQQLKLDLERITEENGLMSQQLADSGRQVRELLKTIIIRDDPSAAARLEDDGSLLPELDAIAPLPAAIPESDTQAVITNELVTFQSLSELCAQNARLLQVTRQLGAKMEDEERNYKARLAEDQDEAVSEARDLIVRLEEEVRNERYKAEEASKERDLFRQLCATGGRTNEAKEQTGQGAPATQISAFPSSEYEAMRSRYENLKKETESDIARYREEVRSLQIEISKTTVTSAREQALRQAAEEKYNNLLRTFELQKADLEDYTRQSTKLRETLAHRELDAKSLEERFNGNQSTLEQLRTQIAVLEAEKNVWKSSETKLLEEHQAMQTERANLQELARNTQAMQAELELRGKDVKARLEQDLKRIQEENDDLRARLASEQDLCRQVSLRREVETKDLQTKLDLSSSELSNAREALAIARTSADHIQLRVEDLTKQLESTKDKLAIYERRDQLARDPVAFRSSTDTQLSREEQLEIELADLKAGRAAAQIEVQRCRLQVEEAAATVGAKQSALDDLTRSYEELKTTSASELQAKSSTIEALQAQVQDLTEKSSTAQTQLDELQKQLDSQRVAFQAEKKSLEDAITELGSIEDRARAEQEDVKGEIRKHVKAAKEAELKLAEVEKNRETLAHELNEVREQLGKARQEASTLRSAKDLAEAEWGREKAGLDTIRQSLEREKTDLQRRIDDLTTQNQILHSHLETINAQANEIRQAAAAPLPSVDVDMEVEQAEQPTPGPEAQEAQSSSEVATETPAEAVADGAQAGGETVKKEEASANTTGADLSATVMKRRVKELQEVIQYLRKEKEVADLQMELNKQETARLKQSLEHVNKTLSEVRTELDNERTKSANASTSVSHHAELLEKINQLNELRESHNTLQETADRATSRVAQLESQLSAATSELAPVKEQLRNAQIELEASQAQVNVLREDSKRWQARAQSLLQTHGISDEMQKVEQQRSEAQSKLEEMQKQLEEQVKATEAVKAELATAKGNFDKLREQVRARIAQERKAVAEMQEKASTLQKEKDEEIAKYKEAVEAEDAKVKELVVEKNLLEKQLEEARSASVAGNGESTPAPAAAATATPTPSGEGGVKAEEAGVVDQQAAIEAAVAEATKQFEEVKARLEAEKAEIASLRDKHLMKGREFLKNQRAAEAEVRARDETIAQLKKEFAENNAEAIEKAVQERSAAVQAGHSGDSTVVAELRNKVQELETKLAAAEARIKELEAQLASGETPDISQLKASHAEELHQLEASLQQKYAEEQKSAIEEAFSRGRQQQQSSAGGGGGDSDVETMVQERLKALEDERETAVQEAIAAAVQAREAELKTQYDESAKARFEAGKNEANLRNQLMIKQKDNKIAKLTAEIASLKGEDAPTTASAAAGTGAGTNTGAGSSLPTRPGVFGRGASQAAARGGRGGSVAGAGQNIVRPVPATGGATPTGPAALQAGRPVPTGPASSTTPVAAAGGGGAPTTTTSIRGAASAVSGRGGGARIAQSATRGARGGGGGAGAQAAGAKRKLSAQQPQQAAAAGAGAGAGVGASADNSPQQPGPKKARPAGAPVTIRRPGQNQGQNQGS